MLEVCSASKLFLNIRLSHWTNSQKRMFKMNQVSFLQTLPTNWNEPFFRDNQIPSLLQVPHKSKEQTTQQNIPSKMARALGLALAANSRLSRCFRAKLKWRKWTEHRSLKDHKIIWETTTGHMYHTVYLHLVTLYPSYAYVAFASFIYKIS